MGGEYALCAALTVTSYFPALSTAPFVQITAGAQYPVGVAQSDAPFVCILISRIIQYVFPTYQYGIMLPPMTGLGPNCVNGCATVPGADEL